VVDVQGAYLVHCYEKDVGMLGAQFASMVKNLFSRVAALAALGLAAQVVSAGPIPYPTPGTLNPVTYTFTAASDGDVVATFAEYTGASFSNDLGLFVGSGAGFHQLGGWGLNNHTSTVGQQLDFGYVTAGTLLTFAIQVNGGSLVYSNPALNAGYDGGTGLNHIYATDYVAGGGLASSVPSGTYVGFEDLPQGGDKNYHDELFVFSNVSVGTPDNGATVALLGLGLVGVVAARRRFSR
jgi:VPDSG-CTERM motif